MSNNRWEDTHWRERKSPEPGRASGIGRPDLWQDVALEAAKLLQLAVKKVGDDPEFADQAFATVRRIYALDASRAHDG